MDPGYVMSNLCLIKYINLVRIAKDSAEQTHLFPRSKAICDILQHSKTSLNFGHLHRRKY